MPCYSAETITQVLDNIKDLELLAEGLREMGFEVREIVNNALVFRGRDRTTGQYQSGSYSGGKLKSEQGLNLEALARYTAVANMKKQFAAANQQTKYTKVAWKLVQKSEFEYEAQPQ